MVYGIFAYVFIYLKQRKMTGCDKVCICQTEGGEGFCIIGSFTREELEELSKTWDYIPVYQEALNYFPKGDQNEKYEIK